MNSPSHSPGDRPSIEVRLEKDASQIQAVCGAPLAQASLVSGHHAPWAAILQNGLRHEPYYVVATSNGILVGLLPLVLVKSLFFGRFLVSLPYLNSAGVLAEDAEVSQKLLDRAVRLADELNVRYLEIRHETELPSTRFSHQFREKVFLRLPLPATAESLWDSFKPKVRNQVRKGEKLGLTVHWGAENLDAFYGVFSHNMRDLGTPVYGRRLFQSILSEFGDDAEICVVRKVNQTLAAALVIHGRGVTEVPSASSLRRFNHTNANMVMYWNLLQRAIERKQSKFDFGRSTIGGNTYRFKMQWGAKPEPAVWQYYLRKGRFDEMRADHDRFQRAVRIWRLLPLGLTRLIGPLIVRGIP